MGPTGWPPWARVEQGCPDRRVDIHQEHHARLKGSLAGRRGAAAGGREEDPASSGWHPKVPVSPGGRRGAGLRHEGAGASRCLLPPFPCHPGSACTESLQVNWSCTRELATSCHHRRSKGRGAAQRGMLEGGEEAGQGGPPVRCTPAGTTAMAGQSLTRSGWGALSLWCPRASRARQSHL